MGHLAMPMPCTGASGQHPARWSRLIVTDGLASATRGRANAPHRRGLGARPPDPFGITPK